VAVPDPILYGMGKGQGLGGKLHIDENDMTEDEAASHLVVQERLESFLPRDPLPPLAPRYPQLLDHLNALCAQGWELALLSVPVERELSLHPQSELVVAVLHWHLRVSMFLVELLEQVIILEPFLGAMSWCEE